MAATVRPITLGRYSDSVDAKDDEVTLLDNKKIYVGTGSDLEIYHDGSHSLIKDTGTGFLKICTNNLKINNAANNENLITAEETGAAKLFYADSDKLETTAVGIWVNGALKGDSVELSDAKKIKLGTSGDLEIYHGGSNSVVDNVGTGEILIKDSGNEKVEVSSTGVKVTGNLEVTGPSKGICTNNLFINGSMEIDQRRAGAAYTGGNAYLVDKWELHANGADEYVTAQQHTLTKASDALPWAAGLRSSLHITNGNQTSGADVADYLGLKHHFEAQNVVNSGWDYNSTSSYVTLSFWIKSSVAQNFYGYIRTQDGTTQAYIFETGSLTADTWTKVTKTIPGHANITIDNNSDAGLSLFLHAFWGTNYTGTTTLNQWAAYSGSVRTPNSTSTWWTTNDATLEVTGFQLEVGEIANDFKTEKWTDELQKCKRYYQKSYEYQDAPGNNTAAGIVLDRYGGSSGITNRTDLAIRWEVEMRTSPTVTVYSKVGTSGKCSDWETGTTHVADRTVDAVLGNSTKGNRGLDMNSAQDDALGYHYSATADY
jgi:hypothetical protein